MTTSSPIQRVAQRLRNIAQLSTQIARVEIDDNKRAELWPAELKAIANTLLDAGNSLLRYANEVDVYTSRRKEDTEALITMASSAANLSTILGSDGTNLEILTHSDPAYILGVLTRGTQQAKREAISQMTDEERMELVEWIGEKAKARVVELEQKAKLLEQRVEKLLEQDTNE